MGLCCGNACIIADAGNAPYTLSVDGNGNPLSAPLPLFSQADLADITRQIGGDRVDVSTIYRGKENTHAVTPKPSHLIAMSRADMFVQVEPGSDFHPRQEGPQKAQARLKEAGDALDADNAQVARLTAEEAKATGARKDALDDQLVLATAHQEEHRDEVDALVSEWCSRHTKTEAMEIIQGAGVAAGAVLDTRDLSMDPELRRCGMMVTIELPKSIDSSAPSITAEVVRVVPQPYPELQGVALKFSQPSQPMGQA